MGDRLVDDWHVVGPAAPLPPADRIIYADGAAVGTAFRPDADLELSHWVPTSTPARWAADTSTEICLRYAADPPPAQGGVAVNNHVDTDGILSLFTLVHPTLALAHRETLIGAAEAGDFWAGVGRSAFRLSQELATLLGRSRAAGWSPRRTYEVAFTLVRHILEGTVDEDPSVATGWAQLERGADRIAEGTVSAEELDERFVSYVLPRLCDDALEAALRVPGHDSPIDGSVWLWPQVRNRTHGQEVHLTSVPGPDGWFHDLWLPGYSWAATPDRWRPPGLRPAGGSNVWTLDHPPLTAAADALQKSERGPGTWSLVETLTPFSSLSGRGFPVALSCTTDDGRPTPSTQAPQVVLSLLAPAVAGSR